MSSDLPKVTDFSARGAETSTQSDWGRGIWGGPARHATVSVLTHCLWLQLREVPLLSLRPPVGLC